MSGAHFPTAPSYRILRKVAEGGCAEIYEARNEGGHSRVALKILHPRHVGNKAEIKRLEDEGALGLRLGENEHIIRTLSVGQATRPSASRTGGGDKKVPFIAMQFMNGRTLREALREKNHFSEEELVALAGAIGRGLRFLHNSEILHKDIKPDNIMLDNEGRVKIIDFGFASTKFGVRFGFWSRRLEGSPAYLAPELIKTKKPSEATDLYALGCTLYEAAVGVVPFAGHSDAEVLHKQTDEKLRPRPVSSINPRTSVFMEKLILNALEKDPKERYRSADEFLMELSRNPLIRRGRSTRFPAGWFREQKS